MNEFDAVPSGRRRRLPTKTLVHWAIACFLSVTGLVSALTGIYFLFLPSGGYQGGRNPDYGATLFFARATWTDIHTWSGVAMVVVGIVHLVLHWRWVAEMLKRAGAVLLGRRKAFARKIWARVLVVVAVILPFLSVTASSMYFLFTPGGGHEGSGAGQTSFLLSRPTWDLLHTWSAVIFIIAVAVHLAMRWKWLARVTPSVFRTPAAVEVSAG
jgi:hypothetical protein